MKWLDGITNSLDTTLSEVSSPKTNTPTKMKWDEVGGQRNLVCYSPWGCKYLDMTEQLNNNVNNVLS